MVGQRIAFGRGMSCVNWIEMKIFCTKALTDQNIPDIIRIITPRSEKNKEGADGYGKTKECKEIKSV